MQRWLDSYKERVRQKGVYGRSEAGCSSAAVPRNSQVEMKAVWNLEQPGQGRGTMEHSSSVRVVSYKIKLSYHMVWQSTSSLVASKMIENLCLQNNLYSN